LAGPLVVKALAQKVEIGFHSGKRRRKCSIPR
jgi:hypothetical protein